MMMVLATNNLILNKKILLINHPTESFNHYDQHLMFIRHFYQDYYLTLLIDEILSKSVVVNKHCTYQYLK